MVDKFAIIQVVIYYKTTWSECCILGNMTWTIWVVQDWDGAISEYWEYCSFNTDYIHILTTDQTMSKITSSTIAISCILKEWMVYSQTLKMSKSTGRRRKNTVTANIVRSLYLRGFMQFLKLFILWKHYARHIGSLLCNFEMVIVWYLLHSVQQNTKRTPF